MAVNVNPSANVALNILANGVVVGTGTLSGLAQNSPWTTVTATWVAQRLTPARRSNSRWWRRTSSRDQELPAVAGAYFRLHRRHSDDHIDPIASVAAWTSSSRWSSGTRRTNWTNTQGIGAPGFSGVSGDQANFNGAAGLNVDLGNFSPSIAGLTFGPSALNYDIKSTGSGQLQLNNGSSNATITVSAGSQTIAAPVVLENNVNVAVAGGTSLTISGGIGQSGGSQGLTLSGGGTMILSGTDNYSGGTVVSAGTLIVTAPAALPSGGSLTVGAGGTFIFDPSVTPSKVTTIVPNETPAATSSDTIVTAASPVAWKAWQHRRLHRCCWLRPRARKQKA